MRDLPPLKVKPRKKPGPKKGAAKNEKLQSEEAMAQVLETRRHKYLGARCNANYFRAPHLGHEGGMCLDFLFIAEGRPDEISTVWGVWHSLCQAQRTYRVQVIGQTGEAKCASITTAPEPLQTSDLDPPVDDRTLEQKHRDAVDGWQYWEDNLKGLPPSLCALLTAMLGGTVIKLWEDGLPKPSGRDFVKAIDALAHVVADRKKSTRG